MGPGVGPDPGNNLLRVKTERSGPGPSRFLLLGLNRGVRQEIAYQRFIWKCFSKLRYGRCLDRFEVASGEGEPEGRVWMRTRIKRYKREKVGRGSGHRELLH